MRWVRWVGWGVVVAVLAGVLVTAAPGVASASCAELHASPYAFVGTVEHTRSDGRLAVVRTESGRVVEVRGGETRNGFGSGEDRTYELGATYEFHPTNATGPFQDNACTATRLLVAAPDGAAQEGTSTQHPSPALAGAVTLAGGVVLALLALVLVRRRRPGTGSGRG